MKNVFDDDEKNEKKIGKASPDKQAVLSKKKKILHYITSIFRAKKKRWKKIW